MISGKAGQKLSLDAAKRNRRLAGAFEAAARRCTRNGADLDFQTLAQEQRELERIENIGNGTQPFTGGIHMTIGIGQAAQAKASLESKAKTDPALKAELARLGQIQKWENVKFFARHPAAGWHALKG